MLDPLPDRPGAPFEIGSLHGSCSVALEAGRCLQQALGSICIDLRTPQVIVEDAHPAPVRFGSADPEIDHLSLAIPQIHRVDADTFYPQLTHDLAVAVGDALLRASGEFVAHSGAKRPPHYRSLGRSAFLAAALDADKKLDRVARSFDFLLSVSPINSREARDRFFEGGAQQAPEFRYRPLTVDPAAAKGELYAVDLSILEDPLLERLLAEKRQEIDHQLTMLATRNTKSFQAASILHYGTVGSRLLEDARAILARPRPPRATAESVGAREVAEAARALVERYRAVNAKLGLRR